MTDTITNHSEKATHLMSSLKLKPFTNVLKEIIKAFQKLRITFLARNGVSGIAANLNADSNLMAKLGIRIKVISVSNNMLLFTAVSNDFCPHQVYINYL